MTKLQRLSQGHLKVLSECPRKFEYIYLDSLFSPTEPDQYQNMQRGSDFHRLMHQQSLGMPIEPFLISNPELGATMAGLRKVAPHLFLAPPQTDEPPAMLPDTGVLLLGDRESEQVRTLLMEDTYLFTVIYDLVILGDKAQIIDWKTHGQPRQPERLAQDWQTRLYMYLLAETSDYKPADISFTYWFVQSQPPTSVSFPYSATLHAQTAADLAALLAKTTAWLNAYPQAFPMVETGSRLCQSCHFAARCDRLPKPSSALALEQLHIDAIAEIPL
jgi:PD-(D/E)XK nuclease superfamily